MLSKKDTCVNISMGLFWARPVLTFAMTAERQCSRAKGAAHVLDQERVLYPNSPSHTQDERPMVVLKVG